MKISEKILLALHHKTTYSVGLLQAKAYRILKKETSEALKGTTISNIDWAFLGLLFEKGENGMQPKDAAHELGTKPPFITEISKVLVEKGMITLREHEEDARANIICLSDKGKKFVIETEKSVRQHMRKVVQGIDANELFSYLSVLDGIIKNNENKRD